MPPMPLRRPSPRTALRRVNVRLDPPTASTDALFILMRRMRGPLVLLILIFAVDVFGLTLMPGVDEQGNPYRLTLFDAFYFMSYTATTIGYGETPFPFTIAQRMWVTVGIYSSVVGWAYALGAVLSLMQDRAFTDAVALQRSARQVRQLREPFLIIAGFGEMGRRVAQTLDAQGRRLVVVDHDPKALAQLEGGRLSIDVPGIDGDVRDPDTLNLAGLTHPYCDGVLALTHEDAVNLAVVTIVQLVRPEVPVYARSHGRRTAAAMRDFGADAVIDPFDRYGDYLLLRLSEPITYQLVTWLLMAPGEPLPERSAPVPAGRWLVVSDDRFGAEIAADLRAAGLDVTEVGPDAPLPDALELAGFVAGTSDEVRNLAMAAHARLQHPEVFLTVRASSAASDPLLRAFAPDSVFLPAQLTAHEALARVITPDFWTFFVHAFAQGEEWSAELLERFLATSGTGSPASRRITLDLRNAPGLVHWLAKHPMTVGDLLRDPQDRLAPLRAVPLILTRHGADSFLPADDVPLQPGDEVVLAGREEDLDALAETLVQRAAAEYVATGNVVPNTWIFRKLSPRVEDA